MASGNMPKPNRFARTDDNNPAQQFKNKRFIYRVESQSQSSLFLLPLELREQIYRFVLPRSYRKSKGRRCDKLGFEEEWGRTQYNERREWQEHAQFPLCLWTRGDMVLLRLCRRITNEATPLFYRHNMFDMAICGDEPVLKIAYFPWPLPSSRCMFPNFTTYGGIRWSKESKRLSLIKREYVRQIRCWSVIFHTLYACQGKGWLEAAEEIAESWEDERTAFSLNHDNPSTSQQQRARAWLDVYCNTMSHERRAYRSTVVQGLQKWIGMLDGCEEYIRQLFVVFEPYPDYKGMGWMTDKKLVSDIRIQMPGWMHEKLFLLGGKIDEEELEAWEVD